MRGPVDNLIILMLPPADIHVNSIFGILPKKNHKGGARRGHDVPLLSVQYEVTMFFTTVVHRAFACCRREGGLDGGADGGGDRREAPP